MPDYSAIPWPQCHDFLAEVGAERTFPDFCARTLERIGDLIPYDIAANCFVMADETGPLVCASTGDFEKSKELFNSYYRYLSPVPFSMVKGTIVTDWLPFRQTEYVTDFIRPSGTWHSMAGFQGQLTLMLHRSRHSAGFSEKEAAILDVLSVHLNNLYALHQTISTLTASDHRFEELAADYQPLSKREAEIIRLLCRRLSTAEIATLLLISPRTVEKHIENIYAKFKVRNRTELRFKLSGEKGSGV